MRMQAAHNQRITIGRSSIVVYYIVCTTRQLRASGWAWDVVVCCIMGKVSLYIAAARCSKPTRVTWRGDRPDPAQGPPAAANQQPRAPLCSHLLGSVALWALKFCPGAIPNRKLQALAGALGNVGRSRSQSPGARSRRVDDQKTKGCQNLEEEGKKKDGPAQYKQNSTQF